MTDRRSRRPPSEQNPQLAKLLAESAAMREQLDALEGRVLRLEAELATVRGSVGKLAAPISVSMAPRAASKRPGRLGPPPLPLEPVNSPSITPRKSSGRKSMIDISEIAELVESIPPPPRAPRR